MHSKKYRSDNQTCYFPILLVWSTIAVYTIETCYEKGVKNYIKTRKSPSCPHPSCNIYKIWVMKQQGIHNTFLQSKHLSGLVIRREPVIYYDHFLVNLVSSNNIRLNLTTESRFWMGQRFLGFSYPRTSLENLLFPSASCNLTSKVA